MQQIGDDESKTLRTFFTLEKPLGNASAIEQVDSSGSLIHSRYVDRNNLLYRGLKRNPTMIVGRRGSGKTDILLNYQFGESTTQAVTVFPKIFFDSGHSAKAITTVINQIEDAIARNYPSPTVEEVSDLWTMLFWVNVYTGIAQNEFEKESGEYILLSTFCNELGLSVVEKQNPLQNFLTTIVSTRKSYNASGLAQSGISYFASFELIKYGGVTFGDIKIAASNWLKKNSKTALILFDSIEAVRVGQLNTQLVMSGLLKSIGGLRSVGSPIDIKCCVPAESYFKLMELSSNVLKDFRDSIVLHWHVSELLRICAIRYMTFLMLWDEKNYETLKLRFPDFNHRDAVRFWNDILPEFVQNQCTGFNERALPYIVRHTQLLPRQIIQIFNEILIESKLATGNYPLPLGEKDARIDSKILTSAVAVAEKDIAQAILNTQEEIWPNASVIIGEVFSRLPSNIVEYGQLHKCFGESGVRNRFHIEDFHSFIRMASELGAIGRLIGKTDEFAIAIFEYSQPYKLIFDPNDTICIHPIFTQRYGIVLENKRPSNYLPVYPRGTDPNSPDNRSEYI